MKHIKKETVMIAVSLVLVFVALINPMIAFIGSIAAIVFMLVSQRDKIKRASIFWIALVAILIAAAAVINIKFFSGEDGWMCDKGAWVRHGNPSEPMPTAGCPQGR